MTSPSPFSTDLKRGSVWRKWDLHTHTPASILNNGFPRLKDGGPDWEQYVTALESTDIAVLGVTDYFTIDGYKKLREYKEAGRLANIACLLPNIEFRLDKLIASRRDGGKPRRLNFHVIFSDELPPEIIEEHFLQDLDFDYEGRPQASTSTRKLKTSNIRDLGMRLAKEHEAFAGSEPLELGASKIVVNLDRILKALEDDRFRGRYVIVLPEELSSLIDWDGQDHQVRKMLLQQSDMVFSPNAKTREWCLGREPYAGGVPAFLAEFKSLKPCVHGADAHTIDQIDRPCSKRSGSHSCVLNATECDMRYLWIKADPTFEGLRQILYEPDSRVQIGSAPPELLSPERTMRRVATVRLPWLLDEGIELNPGLVAIIGARGSGKTALADLMAHASGSALPMGSKDSFLSRAAVYLHSGQVQLTWNTGEVTQSDFHPFEEELEPDVHYLSQQFVERLCTPEGMNDELVDEIQKVVFGAHDPASRLGATSFAELLEEQTGDTRLKRQYLRDRLDRISEEVLKERGMRVALIQKEKERLRIMGERDKDVKLRDGIVSIGQKERAEFYARLRTALDERQRTIQELARHRQSLGHLSDETKRYRSRVFPDLLSDLRVLYIGTMLTEKDWKAFEIAFKGDPDSALANQVTAIDNQVRKVRAGSAKTLPNILSTGDDLATMSLESLQLAFDKLSKEIGVDQAQARKLKQLNDRISAREIEIKKVDAEILRYKGSDERMKLLVEERASRYEEFWLFCSFRGPFAAGQLRSVTSESQKCEGDQRLW